VDDLWKKLEKRKHLAEFPSCFEEPPKYYKIAFYVLNLARVYD
jgi:hypothetical protein